MKKITTRLGSRNAKVLLTVVATCLLVFALVGGSIAWLMASTNPITNVFTYGGIVISLSETTGTNYKMTPGATLAKDPKLTVSANSETCWLYVKIEESSDKPLSNYVSYQVESGWTALPGVSGVYYRAVDMSSSDQTFSVLAGDCVTVLSSVTSDMLSELNSSNYPTLTFTGYAVQRDANIGEIDTAEEAWTLLP